MLEKKPLTEGEMDVLRCIVDFDERNHYQPSIEEIATEIGVSSSAVFDRLRAAEIKGAVKKMAARSYVIPDEVRAEIAQKKTETPTP
jgi:Mn-dependent DtxR family transcriptional regulator